MADNNWSSHWNLDMEFDKKYHRREAEKCCANCMHGDPDFEGEARCSHPKRDYKPGEKVRLNTMRDSVCDLWEPKRETDTLQNSKKVIEHTMETSNIKVLREALCEIVLLTIKAGKSISYDVACGIIASKAKNALKQPPRNCDIGTPEEQNEKFLDSTEYDSYLKDGAIVAFRWGQKEHRKEDAE